MSPLLLGRVSPQRKFSFDSLLEPELEKSRQVPRRVKLSMSPVSKLVLDDNEKPETDSTVVCVT